MLNTILKKRAQASALILLLSVLLIATAAFAATKLIEAGEGGKIKIANGVSLKISPGALEENTIISAYMVISDDYVDLYLSPSGTVFAEPAELKISWKFLTENGIDDVTLYGEDGEEIQPCMQGQHLIWGVPHFSLYYYRRR